MTIKKYGSTCTFYVGIRQVQNGCLYLKVWEQFYPLLFYCNNAPRVLLPQTKAENNKLENSDFVPLLPFFFFPFPHAKLKNYMCMRIRATRTFYIPNKCSTSVDVPYSVLKLHAGPD